MPGLLVLKARHLLPIANGTLADGAVGCRVEVRELFSCGGVFLFDKNGVPP